MNKPYNPKKGKIRCSIIFFLARNLLGGIFKRIFDYHGKPYPVKGTPFLLMATHRENWDPGYELLTFHKYIRFIVSDHLTSKGLISKILYFVDAPLVKRRDHSSEELMEQVKASIDAGVNVGIHVEGGKTNNGETGFISRRNAQLAKECECDLVTFRLTGGYMRSPRWGLKKRKGPVYGEVAHWYAKEEIASMTEEEVYQHILEDLYVNEYEIQREAKRKYLTENLAEHMETSFYVCPKCKSLATLHSKGDKVFCECGFEAKIDEYGFWHSQDMEFDDLVTWDHMQKDTLKSLCKEKAGTSQVIASVENQQVYEVHKDDDVLLDEKSTIFLTGENFVLVTDKEEITIPIPEIRQVHSVSKMTLQIVTDNKYYKIKSSVPRSALMYVAAIRYLQGKEYL